MQLTQFSDIGLRLLMYLAQARTVPPSVTLSEVSSQFNIPKNHLTKVAGKLVKHGWIDATRGRTGGIRLAVPAQQINLGQVLRVLEDHSEVIDCEKLQCHLKKGCELRHALAKAYAAFFKVLDQHSLADVTEGLAGQEIVKMQHGFMQIYLANSVLH